MKRRYGFTLIELVVVIVIVGILAVVAAPKFLQLSHDARDADLEGLAASLRTSTETVYGKAAIVGKETLPNATVDGVAIANGYPTAKGITTTLQNTHDWHMVTVTPSDLGNWLESSMLRKIKTGLTFFTLKAYGEKGQSLKQQVKAIDAGQCYVVYVDVAHSDFSKTGNKTKNPGWFWGFVCGKILAPLGIDKYVPWCPTHQKSDANSHLNSNPTQPAIVVVDSGC